MAPSVDDVINQLGFGKFSCKLLIIAGLLLTVEEIQLNLVSLISPLLRCQWNLSPLQTGLISSSVLSGMGFSSIYWGWLADKYGRKRIMITFALFSVYFGFLGSNSPSYVWFIILQFFVGIGVGAAATMGPCFIAEYIPTKHRGKSVIALNFFDAFGSMYISLMALLFMNMAGWRIFFLSSTFPPIIFLVFSSWLPESIRYLQNKGDDERIINILYRYSAENKIPLPRCVDIECLPTEKQGCISLLLTKDFCFKMLVVAVLWISCYYAYYGVILLNTEILQNNHLSHVNMTTKVNKCYELKQRDYIQNIIVAIAEFPGLLLPVITVDTIGRKGFMFPAFFLSGIGFLCLNFGLSGISSTVFIFILRLLTFGLCQMPCLYAAELFPTSVRASAMGILNATVYLSMIGVPFLMQVLLHVSFFWTTMIIAILCFLSAALLFLMPETNNKSLDNS